ncbi:hypothetical protein B5P45_17570 [Phyllobacterium zundukense]|uniref:Uncharacterized protein n=1 Tax=Phyllobacterium zundukense TaxID=1867719 RepID=A0A2N9VW38_9HYPH|nr:hypothetical protein BLM14_07185 [Phyllobacterium zundukense]PIO43706.1 hypothetical protein B5P45_17570 [Phyllobacterium zundukense]
MEKEDYQANWRGARRYQFDEVTRLKKLAMQSRDQIVNFRGVKWADPEHKLKVLVEDFDPPPPPRVWLDRISTRLFYFLIAVACVVVFSSVLILAR